MNVTRKISAGAIAALSIAGACVMTAAPAQAAAQTISSDCSTSDPIHIYARPGDTLTIVMTSATCDDIWNVTRGNNDPAGAIRYDGSLSNRDYHGTTADWYLDYSGSTTTTVTTLLENVGNPAAPLSPGDQIFVFEGAGYSITTPVIWDGLEAPAATGSTPPPWFQSHGRLSATDTCETGWSSSWAQWPNGGTGGFVCNRVVAYDSTSGTWINQ